MERFSEEAIDEVLRRESEGVLALADGNEPYGLPVSFGYDGERFVFQLSNPAGGRKTGFIDASSSACFVVHARRPNKVVESVIASGPLTKVPQSREREAFTVLRDNAEFPLDDSIWQDSPDSTGSELYELVPESLSGRAYETGRL